MISSLCEGAMNSSLCESKGPWVAVHVSIRGPLAAVYGKKRGMSLFERGQALSLCEYIHVLVQIGFYINIYT